jgi:acyl-coenzyme A thioesterase PaaI-like protein
VPDAAGETPWDQRVHDVLHAEVSHDAQSLRRLAGAVRRLVDRIIATDAPVEVIDAATTDVERTADRFDGFGRYQLYKGYAETANAGDPYAFFDRSPIIGKGNPLAPPLELDVVDGRVHGRAHFGAAYEGPPGCVHGGFIAAAFDDLLGLAQSLSGLPGMTGTLTIRYRKPTPLHTDLTFDAELVKVDGRKKFTRGELRNPAGDVTAEAEAVFISVELERFLQMQEEARKGLPGT